MHIFIKYHFSRSMLKGYENELKSNALGRRRGLENRSNLDANAHRKSMHKLMDFEVKIAENRVKTVPQTMLFSIAFFYRFRVGFGRVWGGFWEEFGGSWRLLGRLWGILFRCFYLEWALGGLLEPPGLDFGWILRGWGGVREGFWRPIWVF